MEGERTAWNSEPFKYFKRRSADIIPRNKNRKGQRNNLYMVSAIARLGKSSQSGSAPLSEVVSDKSAGS